MNNQIYKLLWPSFDPRQFAWVRRQPICKSKLIACRSVGVSVGCSEVVALWVSKANFHFGLNMDHDQCGYDMQQVYSKKIVIFSSNQTIPYANVAKNAKSKSST